MDAPPLEASKTRLEGTRMEPGLAEGLELDDL